MKPSSIDRGRTREGRAVDVRRQLVIGTGLTVGLFLIILGLLDLAQGTAGNAPGLFLSGTLIALIGVLVYRRVVGDAVGGHLIFGALFSLGLVMVVVTAGQLDGVYIIIPVITLLAVLLEPFRWAAAWVCIAVLEVALGALLLKTGSPALITVNESWVLWAPYRMSFLLSVLALMIGRHYANVISEFRLEAEENAQRWQQVSDRANRNELRFQDFAGQAADWFWETDAEHLLTFLSRGFENRTGIKREQVLGQRPDQVYQDLARRQVNPREALRDMESRQPFVGQKLFWRHEDRKLVMINRGRPRFGRDGQFLGYRGVVHDVTEEEELRRRLHKEATTDELTGLHNRRYFLEAGEGLLEAAAGERNAALIFLDLDYFKPINDQGGHAAGDQMLRQLAKVIRAATPDDGLGARLGGDEFCILMPEVDLPRAKQRAEDLLAAIRSVRVEANGIIFSVGASIGVACETPVADRRIDAWIRAADAAAYVAKDAGRCQVRLSAWGASP